MNLLIGSHFFAPYSKVGARRMTSFAIYLAQRGHNVYVIKANDREYGDNVVRNAGQLGGIKEIRPIGYYSGSLIKSSLNRAGYYKKEISAVMDSCHIDAVVMSSEPTEYLPLFRFIKRKDPSVICVMDIRDPLGLDDHYGGNALSFKRKLYILNNVRNERKAAKFVDYISVVTEESQRYYQRRYPSLGDRILCIKNGFDDINVNVDEIADSHSEPHRDAVYLGVFGQYYLYGAEYSECLVRLAKEYKDKAVIVRQFGVHDTELEDMFRAQGLEDRYEFVRSEGYPIDIARLASCDICVASHHTRSSCGTKIYDYMLVNRPIISLNPYYDSELSEQVRQFENGYACTNYEEFRSAFYDIAGKGSTVLDRDRDKLLANGRKHQFDLLTGKIESMLKK